MFDKRATRDRKIAYRKPDKTELMGCSFRRLIANLKTNSYSASILRTEEVAKAKVKNRTLLTHWPTTTLTILPEAIGGEGGRGGSVAPHPPSTKNLGGRAAAFKCQKTLLRMYLSSH